MLRRTWQVTVLVVVAASAWARTALAQATVGADLSMLSGYVWRGISVTNRPVGQPNAYVAFPAGATSVTAGGWANVDLGQYDDSDEFSQSGGVSSFNLAEFDPWAEVSVPAGKATLTGGVVGYLFPNDVGATEALNTWEVYGKVGLAVPLSPKLAVYYDVDKVSGAYLEGSVAHSLPLGSVSLAFGALAGLSAGQAEADDPDELNNFAENGFTHLDLSAGMPLAAGIFTVTPVLHFLVNGDQNTKATSPGEASDVKLWGGLTINWSQALGATE
ncbi:MAG TPA: TorF family putative porin [Gemmatimonadales bacterium]|nr:TorF family putative porin [Gemmatimonadales bacterium]